MHEGSVPWSQHYDSFRCGILTKEKRCQRRHVESGTYRRSASPDLSLPLLASAVSVQWGHSYERTDLLPIQCPEFWEQRNHRH